MSGEYTKNTKGAVCRAVRTGIIHLKYIELLIFN